MNKNKVLLLILITIVMFGAAMNIGCKPESETATTDGQVIQKQAIYVCPMHPAQVSSQPGKCSICGMNLVQQESK